MSTTTTSFVSVDLDSVLDRVRESSNARTDAAVARELEAGASSVSTWRARGTVPYANLIAFAKRHRISIEWLLFGDEETAGRTVRGMSEPDAPVYGHLAKPDLAVVDGELLVDYVLVPRYNVRVAGGHGASVTTEDVIDRLAFRADWLRRMGFEADKLALVELGGDSMEPTLTEGDLLLVDLRRVVVGREGIYVLKRGEEVTAKRCQSLSNRSVRVVSDNSAYAEELVGMDNLDDLGVVGRVVWVGRML